MKDILKAKRPFDVVVKHPSKNIEIRRRAMVVANFRGSTHVITRAIETNDRHGWYLSKEEIFIFNKRGRVLYNLDKLPKLMKNFCWSYRFDEVKDVILTSNILITFGIK